MSQSCRARYVFRCAFDSAKFKLLISFFFWFVLFFFLQFFMSLLVKIYMKKHNKTLWTTDFFNSVFCLVSCTSTKSSSIFHTEQSYDRLNFDTSAAQKKKKVKKKTHLGQVFHSVTSFETLIFFFSLIVCKYELQILSFIQMTTLLNSSGPNTLQKLA